MTEAPDAAWTMLQWFEFLSYLVTVVGLPFAILVYVLDQQRERQNEDEAVFERLTDQYTDFLKLVLDHADLQLLRRESSDLELSVEQKERKYVLFGILIAILQSAYMLVYEERMNRATQRLWQPWDDYTREWCRRPDFRESLATLLIGEDEDFRSYITRVAREETAREEAGRTRTFPSAA